MGDDGDLVATRLARGCRCFAAWRAEAITAYAWLTAGREWIGEVGLEINPGPGEAYIWNCVTLPPYRRQGVFSDLLAQVCEVAEGEGFRRLWIAGLTGTAESALPPLGFEQVLTITGQVAEGTDQGLAVLGLARGLPVVSGSPRRH
jgi:GNAT superfamily N-acetyltransferase